MNILRWFETKPPVFRILLIMCIVSAISMVDHLTGGEIAISIFYLIPIAAMAWIDGLLAGILMSILCGILWLVADLSSGHTHSSLWIPYWNMTVRLGFFVIVASMLSQLKRSQIRDQELSRIDTLTGLWNARYFLELLDRESKRHRRFGRSMTIAYIDLDQFKTLNDTKGHAEGDLLLRDIGRKIKQEVRHQDIPARLGGDEFVVLLSETHFDAADHMLNRLMHTLTLMMESRNCPVTFSIGAITYQTPLSTIEDMIKRADDLMYKVKKNGKAALRHELIQ